MFPRLTAKGSNRDDGCGGCDGGGCDISCVCQIPELVALDKSTARCCFTPSPLTKLGTGARGNTLRVICCSVYKCCLCCRFVRLLAVTVELVVVTVVHCAPVVWKVQKC